MYNRTRRKLMSDHIIYTLQCENNKYYVGKTVKSVYERFLEHKTGKTCSWTKVHKPLEIIDVVHSKTNFAEDNITKECMMKYGIDNVRGGSYSNVNLHDYQLKALNHEFLTFDDKCYVCHEYGHLSPRCPQNNTPKNNKRKHTKFDFKGDEINNNDSKKIKKTHSSDSISSELEEVNIYSEISIHSEDEKINIFNDIVLKIIAKIELFFNISDIKMNIDNIFSYNNVILISKKNIIIIIMNEIIKCHEKLGQTCIICKTDVDNIQNCDLQKAIIKIFFIYETLRSSIK